MLKRLMRSWTTLICTVAIAVLVAVECQASVIFTTDEIDLTTIYRDEPQRLVFEFENASDDTLHFVDVEPSCDCTTAEIIPQVVPPHSRGRVVVFFDPMGYERRDHFTEFVRLTTTDIQTPEVLLAFRGKVEVGPEPEPRSLIFGTLCKGASDTLDLRIHLPSRKPVNVLDAYSDTSCIIVKDVGASSDTTHDFLIIASNTQSCGRFAGFVTVLTSDSLREQVRVPVTASFAGHIVAEPDVIAFGSTLAGTYVNQTVRVYAVDGREFSVPEARCTIDGIIAEITRLEDGSCRIRLKVKEDAPRGRVSGKLIIETDCPDEAPIEVDVTGYIRNVR